MFKSYGNQWEISTALLKTLPNTYRIIKDVIMDL